VTERAIFKDVRLVRPVQDGFKRYADDIGSVLEILDIQMSLVTAVVCSRQGRRWRSAPPAPRVRSA
jgi:hypothetical protein